MALQVVRPSVGRYYASRGPADLHEQFGQLVQSVLGPVATAPQAPRAWQPHTEVNETEAAYVVTVEVPGLPRDAAKVEVDRNVLRISGEYAGTDEDGEGKQQRTRRTGRFEYRATLPRTVDAEKIGAELTDGVLTVTVPKAEIPEPRRVEIAAG